MFIKSDFPTAPLGRRPVHPSRKSHPGKRRQPPARLVLQAGMPLLVLFAVFCGLLGPQEDLERMGVSLGPTHL